MGPTRIPLEMSLLRVHTVSRSSALGSLGVKGGDTMKKKSVAKIRLSNLPKKGEATDKKLRAVKGGAGITFQQQRSDTGTSAVRLCSVVVCGAAKR